MKQLAYSVMLFGGILAAVSLLLRVYPMILFAAIAFGLGVILAVAERNTHPEPRPPQPR